MPEIIQESDDAYMPKVLESSWKINSPEEDEARESYSPALFTLTDPSLALFFLLWQSPSFTSQDEEKF